ncbi:cyclic nucleotide-binding domain-containing protein [Muricauda sp. TY007]|uniref:Crp/Fnr family transcriptional regulator n=1 Tax=Allomuricauda sp. TY007 TaxID=2683200 RepID=UPI0013C101C7|nr:Crp/Fnr family transcriptional regulator [Muricauda sp. TY007]NDV15442.1 cyclic nucleotide-binding domain-containing protein [Muricauda sp. TY007]
MDIIQELYHQIDKENLWKKEVSLKRNEYLKVSGSTDTNLYYIIAGAIKIFILDDYEEHIIRFGYEKDFVATLDSFLSEQPSDVYIQAIRKSELKVISKVNFFSLINSNERNKQIWDTFMEQLILQLLEREKDILTVSPAKRYQRVLKRSPQLFQEIPNKHIASYLRMTPETLSRLKKS